MSEQMNYMQRVGHSRCVRCDFETSDDMTFEQQDAAMMAHLADKHPDWMGIGRAEPSPEPEAAPASEAQALAVSGETPLSGWCSSCDRIDEPGNFKCSTCGDTLIFDGEEADYLRNQLEGCAIVSRNYQAGVEYLKESGYGEQWKLVAICRQSLDACIAELAQLRARVAILDAQEARLPELTEAEIIGAVDSLFWDSHPSSFNAMPDATHNRQIIEAFRMGVKAVGTQLLDALRAVQAWREVAANGAHALMQHDTYSGTGLEYDFNRFVSQKHNTIAAYDALAGKGE